MTYKIIFSKKAYLSLVLEVRGKISTETGGVLLGGISSDCFHVVETLDPGPKSIFQVAYFEYDTEYVNHLATKVSRQYINSLKTIGLWHRHPGSFDVFSGTDDSTNAQFAKLNQEGAVSLLVNIDPNFRLTCYHVTYPMKYERIPYEINDTILEKYPLHEHEEVIEGINSYGNRYNNEVRNTFNKKAIEELLKFLNTLPAVDFEAAMTGEMPVSNDSELLNLILEEAMEDINFLSSIDTTVSFRFTRGELKLASKVSSELFLKFVAMPTKKLIMISDGKKWHEYKRGMLSASMIGET